MIVGCIGIYGERVDQALVGIKRLRPYVNRYVVIVDDTVTEEQRQMLRNAGCEVYYHKWQDSMVKMRNQYLAKIQTNDWVIVSDPDEWFNDQFCSQVMEICQKAEDELVDLLLINSHDTTVNQDGSTSSTVSDFFKNLIYHKLGGTHYVGSGEIKEVHEELVIPQIKQTRRLDKKYWYEHVKYWHEVWERAMRNVFMGGGGNNAGTKNPSYSTLRFIFRRIGIDNWTAAREYLRKGNVDPLLKDWFYENRVEGFDYDHEEMEAGRWYFEYLHPEEAKFPDGRTWTPILEKPKGSPAEVMSFVEKTYMEVFGRNADQQGKENYTSAILDGTLKREDLVHVLKSSQEYSDISAESVRINVPVSIDARITEDAILQAMFRSKTYWNKIMPRLEMGMFLEQRLGDRWEEFQKWYFAEADTLTVKNFMKKVMEMTKNVS